MQPGSRLAADVDQWRPRTTGGDDVCAGGSSDDQEGFMATEKALGWSWTGSIEESMREAAEEEKRNAIKRGSFHEGVPAIAVIIDGVEQTHTHKDSYNAKSGAVIIIRRCTLVNCTLHVGANNKYCSVYAQSTKRNE